MPSHPERRARQAVLLAQKVLETESQRDDAINKLNIIKKEMKKLYNEKNEAELSLKRSDQPTVYLVTKLRDMEALLQETKLKLKDNELIVKKVLESKKKIENDNDAIRERMRLMLHQRGEIDQLRGLLETLQTPSGTVGTGAKIASPVSAHVEGEEKEETINNSDAPVDEDFTLNTSSPNNKAAVAASPSVGVSSINRPAAIDTGFQTLTGIGSQSPTSQAAHVPARMSPGLSPEQVTRMTASPTNQGSATKKWHTREEI